MERVVLTRPEFYLPIGRYSLQIHCDIKSPVILKDPGIYYVCPDGKVKRKKTFQSSLKHITLIPYNTVSFIHNTLYYSKTKQLFHTDSSTAYIITKVDKIFSVPQNYRIFRN